MAQKANWGARGIAVAFSYGSYAAHVAEVSGAPDGKGRVHKIVCAIDAGIAVNPDQVKAQWKPPPCAHPADTGAASARHSTAARARLRISRIIGLLP